MEYKNWKEILNTVESESNDNILEQIKTKLKEQHNDTYTLWKDSNFDVNYKFLLGNTHHTLLSIAAYTDNKRVVEALLKVGNINVNVQYDGKRTLLHWAAQNGYTEIVKALSKAKNINVNEFDIFMYTPLHWAAQNGHTDIVEDLLKVKNINVNVQSNLGCTPLHYAAQNGRIGTVEALLKKEGIDVNVKDICGMTPLHYAAQNGRTSTVKALLKVQDIEVNVQGNCGRTPLHYAAQNSRIGTVEALLKKEGIKVNVQDTYGMTPLHYAAQNGLIGTVKALLNAGADPLLKNKSGETPRDLATDKNVKQLLNKNKNRENVSSILNSTKENKLPIMTASAGLLLGIGIGLCLAYFAGAATLIPVGGVVAIFIAAVVFGTLVGYGVGKFCEKVSEEKQKNPNMGTWDAAKSVLSGVFTTGHYKEEHRM